MQKYFDGTIDVLLYSIGHVFKKVFNLGTRTDY